MEMNKKLAFKHFGIEQKNEVWSWAGISNDGKIVALTIWTDQREVIKDTKNGQTVISYKTSTFNQNNEIWKDLHGNKERIKIIKYCLKELDGRFRVIFVKPEKPDVIEEKRDIKSVKPFDKLWFKIKDFNEETGEFSSESIPIA